MQINHSINSLHNAEQTKLHHVLQADI